MPGILPMKMIRVGPSTQSRIAQACDRCRSKKIRCDGVRPCCTQCANVGFECKTSDKLSRRAFPRGYTESLEDRVRGLEAEVRELKALLDEKDEKIDMLSRIHSFSSRSRKCSMSPTASAPVKLDSDSPRQDVILVELPVAVQPLQSSNGTPTTAALIEAFEEKVHAIDRPCPTPSLASLLTPHHLARKLPDASSMSHAVAAPPRLLSDQYINIFFQEWQPLLPILHRPTFLRVYEQYLLDPGSPTWQKNRHALAQLFLLFEISAYSSSSRARPATSAYELQWRRTLSAISTTPTVATLQAHILAQLCYLLKADYSHLLRHRAYAVSMIHQLCLHQGHKCHSLPVFEAETRKKLLWCQYTLDKFASAMTGTPHLLRDADISAEYPADIDDENISTQGVSPALPGELTRISSALALFRASRILAKTLENLYPHKASYQLSIAKLHSLSDELDQWQEDLPDHLRLRFRNDKPATNLISCRSPILSLFYFYIRSLIHRPLLCYGSGSSTSAATIVLAAAAKHQLQILDLLDERSMNYTFPLNKQDMLVNAGFAILWQSVALEEGSKLIKDNQRSLALLLNKLTKENQPAAIEFQRVAASVMPQSESRQARAHTDFSTSADHMISSMPAPSDSKPKSARKQLQAMASRLSSFTGKAKNESGVRRARTSQSGLSISKSPDPRTSSTASLSSTRSAPVLPSPLCYDLSSVNLDYFPLGNEVIGNPSHNSSSTMLPPRKADTSINSQAGKDLSVAGSSHDSPEMFRSGSPSTADQVASLNESADDWTSDVWQISTFDIEPKPNTAQSLLSFSEESLTSGDDLLFSAAGSHNGSTSTNDTSELSNGISPPMTAETFRGLMMPTTDDEFDFDEINA